MPTPFLFKRVALVGVGLMGGSLGMALRERRLAETIVGVGRSTDALEKAIRLGAIDMFSVDFAEGVAEADCIVLGTPIPQILADIERLPTLIKPGVLVTDVGSTKMEIVEIGDTFLPGAFVGGHPMAGSERAGVEAARPTLFVEATWAVTPTSNTDRDRYLSLVALAQSVGSRTVTLSPNEHDRAVAVTSHLPHVLAYALAAVAGDRAPQEPHLFDLAAGSFDSGTRVANSSPELWRDIALTNRAALIDALRDYRAELDSALAALESSDGDALMTHFQRGWDARQKANH